MSDFDPDEKCVVVVSYLRNSWLIASYNYIRISFGRSLYIRVQRTNKNASYVTPFIRPVRKLRVQLLKSCTFIVWSFSIYRTRSDSEHLQILLEVQRSGAIFFGNEVCVY